MTTLNAVSVAVLFLSFLPTFSYARKPQLTPIVVNGHHFKRLILLPDEVFRSEHNLMQAQTIYGWVRQFVKATYTESGLINENKIVREGGPENDIVQALMHSVTFIYFEDHVNSLDDIDIHNDIAMTVKIFLPNEASHLPVEQKLEELNIAQIIYAKNKKLEVGNLAKSKRWSNTPLHYFAYKDFQRVIGQYLPLGGDIVLETSAGVREKTYRIYGFERDLEFYDEEMGVRSVVMSTSASNFLSRIMRLGKREVSSSRASNSCENILSQSVAFR